MGLFYGIYFAETPWFLSVHSLPARVRNLAAARLRAYVAGRSGKHQARIEPHVLSVADYLEKLPDRWSQDSLRTLMLFTNDLDADRRQSVGQVHPELLDLSRRTASRDGRALAAVQPSLGSHAGHPNALALPAAPCVGRAAGGIGCPRSERAAPTRSTMGREENKASAFSRGSTWRSFRGLGQACCVADHRVNEEGTAQSSSPTPWRRSEPRYVRDVRRTWSVADS
jgi:hypothetical protein